MVVLTETENVPPLVTVTDFVSVLPKKNWVSELPREFLTVLVKSEPSGKIKSASLVSCNTAEPLVNTISAKNVEPMCNALAEEKLPVVILISNRYTLSRPSGWPRLPLLYSTALTRAVPIKVPLGDTVFLILEVTLVSAVL